MNNLSEILKAIYLVALVFASVHFAMSGQFLATGISVMAVLCEIELYLLRKKIELREETIRVQQSVIESMRDKIKNLTRWDMHR